MCVDRADVRRSFITTTVWEESQVTRAPPVGFELETNGFQFYAIANLDTTSLNKLRLEVTMTGRPVNKCRPKLSGMCRVGVSLQLVNQHIHSHRFLHYN